MWLLRFLMLLALIVWIGGIIFFAFVLAPTVFNVLPTTKLAGDVVSVALTKLHWIGLASGIVFLGCSLIYNWQKHGQLRAFAVAHVFVVLMLALTAYSQFSITPRMRELRADLERVQNGYNPLIRSGMSSEILTELLSGQFDRLHIWSTRLEGGVLFLGLGIVVLTARRFGSN